jgi:squalene-associated FAD-dependent desaturase
VVEASTLVNADVVVIGGGFAGLSAAAQLAAAGRRVVVVEASPRLGGRASTFEDRETGARVDNGQHVLFGCYRETYNFLKRIGTDALAPLDPALAVTMIDDAGIARTLSCPRLPAPWHLIAGVLTWNAVPIRDRLRVFRIARALRAVPGPEGPGLRTFPGLTVSDWLRAHGQSAALCRWLWNPLAFAALNQSPDVAAAGPFVRVLTEMFGPRPEDSAVGLPSVPLDELYALPAARFVEARGGEVLTGAAARISLDRTGRISQVTAGARSIAAGTVISAVPWHAFAGMWQEACPAELSLLRDNAGQMRPSPIVTLNLWLDRPVMSERFAGLVGDPMHWVFNKGRHLSVVSSGASALAAMTSDQIVTAAIDQLTRALPDLRARRIERTLVVKERRATFSLAPGEPPRPATRTPLPGFFMAGDWIDTGLPATIESAVLSGHRAAQAVLDGVAYDR